MSLKNIFYFHSHYSFSFYTDNYMAICNMIDQCKKLISKNDVELENIQNDFDKSDSLVNLISLRK